MTIVARAAALALFVGLAAPADAGREAVLKQMSALAQSAQILTRSGEDAFALQAVHAIAEDSQRLHAFIGIADALTGLGKKDEAVRTLNEAAHLAARGRARARRPEGLPDGAGGLQRALPGRRLGQAASHAAGVPGA